MHLITILSQIKLNYTTSEILIGGAIGSAIAIAFFVKPISRKDKPKYEHDPDEPHKKLFDSYFDNHPELLIGNPMPNKDFLKTQPVCKTTNPPDRTDYESWKAEFKVSRLSDGNHAGSISQNEKQRQLYLQFLINSAK